jgi:hypothetical protein
VNPLRSRRLAALASLALVADPVGTGLAGISALVLTGAALVPVQTEAAQRKGGGGGGRARPASRPSGGASRPAGGGARPSVGSGARPGGGGAGRPPVRGGSTNNINHSNRNSGNVNVNNVNVNRNVNVNGGGGYYGGGYDHYDDWDDHWHPVATAAAVTMTAAVVGSIVRSVPPSCSTVIVNGASYSQCGSTWYQPQYSGSSVQYVVVNPPR